MRLLVLAADGLAVALALEIAMALRFEGAVPPAYRAVLAAALPLAVGLRLLANMAGRLHRWAFRNAGLHDALRIPAWGLVASAALIVLCPRVAGEPLPRTVYALEFFLSVSFFAAIRFGPRVALAWWHDQLRRRAGAQRTVIVGTGPEAELLGRDLKQRAGGAYHVVGFVSEERAMVGCRFDGAAVLGLTRHLPWILREHQVKMVLIPNRLPAERLRALLGLCRSSRVRFQIVPASFSTMDRQFSSAMLADLAPEDLLPRLSVPFDEAEIRSLVSGRRCLVSGAGGSIGSEICRQLAQHGARQVVMVDINENEMYLSARALRDRRSGTDVRVEVADVREPARLQRLGAHYRPEIVFHAAAHKHVPLMEDAPEEAIKNNVFGTIHMARMADRCGAEKFVLISTDKAVNPSSVMGVSKRIAEMSMRHIARTSATRMTAVRFGNVLGSNGSVIPIFKRQIEQGGPVTVTHPDCRRYFMTVSEAVGLVLLAGLGGYGDLCVLDMGEQISIADMARNLVTLSGHVPDEDIRIVFTGLRPGEKLYEELLTEEEEASRSVRDRIMATRSPPPPPDLEARLADLRFLADVGDQAGVLRMCKQLVPTFQGSVEAAPRARPAAARPGNAEVEPTPERFHPEEAIGAPATAVVAMVSR